MSGSTMKLERKKKKKKKKKKTESRRYGAVSCFSGLTAGAVYVCWAGLLCCSGRCTGARTVAVLRISYFLNDNPPSNQVALFLRSPYAQHQKSPSTPQVKMSISNEALQKLVREIETQAMVAQQQISLVRTQQASKQRELRMAQLTRTEVSSLPADTGVYEGVGKMFVALPMSGLQEKLEEQIKEAQKETEGLGKKLQSLELTQKNSRDHIDRMLRGGMGAS
ncbi:hypothetical protein TruAng_006783 [Truncatella angustata]|nr:hypothetical protein TruAng_006783 [Truncatella angustata]